MTTVLEEAPPPPTFQRTDAKTPVLARLLAQRYGKPVERLLVVGCGSGVEAALLGREMDCEVVGIDLAARFDPAAAAMADLRRGDATALDFADASFDFVYSYHALEHIPDWRRALREMDRVLAAGGGYCVGTPNRARMVGYLGSANTSVADKLRWNMADWSMRLKGRFRNEFGAHAGFTRGELGDALSAAFGTATDISLDYYLGIYPHRRGLVQGIATSGLGDWLFPSVYFTGTRTARTA